MSSKICNKINLSTPPITLMRRRSESPSSITRYMTCPKSYDFRYIQKLPDPSGPAAELGNAFHQAAYDSWHTQCWDHKDWLIQSMLQAMYMHEEVAALPHPKLVEGVTCEYNLQADMGGQDCYGFVDLLLDDVGYAVDFKTSSKPWDEEKIMKNYQHLCYTYGLRKIKRSPVTKFLYIVVTTKHPKCQVISLEVSDSVCAEYAKKFMGVVKYIELDLFMPTPSRDACRYCPYKNVCPAWKDGAKPF